MTQSAKALHRFSAFTLASLAVLFWLLGVFDMELIEAIEYLGTVTLLTFSFIGSIYLFGKMLEIFLKK